MPQTRLARHQRLHGNRLTQLVREVIPLCNKSPGESNAKNLYEGFGKRERSNGSGIAICNAQRSVHQPRLTWLR